MESGPSPFGPEMGAEVLQPPVNLLQAYGDREVTMFGMTGTLDELAGMCPIDLTDPSKIDAVNTFVVKAANEAGLEVEPEHEAIFAKVIEEAGLEQKFKLAERPPANADAAPQETQAVKEAPVEAEKPEKPDRAYSEPQAQNTEQMHERAPSDSVAVPPAAATAVLRLIEYGPKETVAQPQAPVLHIEQPRLEELHRKATAEHAGNAPKTIEQLPREQAPFELPQADTFVAEQAAALTPLAALTELFIAPDTTADAAFEEAESLEDVVLAKEESSLTEALPSPVPPLETQIDAVFADLSDFIDIITPVRVVLAEAAEQPAEVEPTSVAEDWGEVLVQPPTQISSEFAELLSDLAFIIDTPHEPVAPDTLGEAEDHQQEAATQNKEVTKELADVLQLVSGRITEKQGDEEVAASIRNIVGAVHGIHLLKEQHKSEAYISLVEQQLEAYVAELFTQLGFEPDERVIKLFTLSLLQPQSAPRTVRRIREVLERDELGTYESKYVSLQNADPLDVVTSGLHHFLGKMATYYAQTLEISSAQAV